MIIILSTRKYTKAYILCSVHLVPASSSVHRFLLQQQFEAEWLKSYAFAHKVLTHSLHPVQAERVQHGTRAFHHTKHRNREDEPEEEGQNNHEDTGRGAGKGECTAQRHGPEHDGKLLMGERESPETEVRGCVGHAVETKFDRVCGGHVRLFIKTF